MYLIQLLFVRPCVLREWYIDIGDSDHEVRRRGSPNWGQVVAVKRDEIYEDEKMGRLCAKYLSIK